MLTTKAGRRSNATPSNAVATPAVSQELTTVREQGSSEAFRLLSAKLSAADDTHWPILSYEWRFGSDSEI